MEQWVKQLSSIIPDQDRLVTGSIDNSYLTDTLGRMKGHADALAFPLSTEEVSKVMKLAYEFSIPVTPRGAGTNLVGSTVPQHGGIVLDLSRMNRILEFDPDTFTITVEPGAVLADVQSFVEARGLFYPPDPGEKKATIGGNISTNAGGMRAVKYGVTRDYVRGLEAVLPDGKIICIGGKNVKDSSGLSLKNVLIGSEGMLAVLTKCILKLIPKPPVSASVLISFHDLETGISSVAKLIHQNTDPTAVEFLERRVALLGEDFLKIKLPFRDANALILMTFDGSSEDAVKARISKACHAAMENGAKDFQILSGPKQAQNVWKVRGALVKAVEAVSEQEPIDIVVPINRIADFVTYVHRLEQESKVHMVSFGHAGDGNVHLCIIRGGRDERTWKKDLAGVMTKLYSKSHELGGLPSGEHGIGIAKKPYFRMTENPVNLALMERIKRAFDFRNIMNPGKTYS